MPKTARRPDPQKKHPPKILVPPELAKGPNVLPRPGQSRMECVFITPAIAAEWLSRNKRNRPRGDINVTQIVQAIEAGAWELNGETIKFDLNGDLRDGQTRLEAIVLSQKGVWSWVCYDIEPDYKTFDTIDQVRKRSLGQLLGTRKKHNYNALAQAIETVYNLDEEIEPVPGGFVPRIGLGIADARPDIEASLDFVLKAGVRQVYSEGRAAGLHYLMKALDSDLADHYWESLANGVITNQRSPLRAVRDTLVANKNASPDKRLTPTTLLAIVIKGWNLMRENRPCKYIRWNGVEPFPSLA